MSLFCFCASSSSLPPLHGAAPIADIVEEATLGAARTSRAGAIADTRRRLARDLGVPEPQAQRVFTQTALTIALEMRPPALERARVRSQRLLEQAATLSQRTICAGMALFFHRSHRLSQQDIEPVRRLGPEACHGDPQAVEDILVGNVERLNLVEFDRIQDLASACSRASSTMPECISLAGSGRTDLFEDDP